jgi:hypothetical protein
MRRLQESVPQDRVRKLIKVPYESLDTGVVQWGVEIVALAIHQAGDFPK